MSRARNLAELLNASGLVPLPTKVVGTLPRANANLGAVLQVVQATFATTTSTTSTSYVDTGLTASITPLFATSKVLVIVSQQFDVRGLTENFNGLGVRIMRDAVSVAEYGQAAAVRGVTSSGTVASGAQNSFTWLDSPNSAAALTYKTQFRTNGGVSSQANNSNSQSTILLLEVAA